MWILVIILLSSVPGINPVTVLQTYATSDPAYGKGVADVLSIALTEVTA